MSTYAMSWHSISKSPMTCLPMHKWPRAQTHLHKLSLHTPMVVQISSWKISSTPGLPWELHLAFIIMCPENTLCTSNEIIMSWMFKFPAHKNPSLILQAFWSSPWPYHNICKNKGCAIPKFTLKSISRQKKNDGKLKYFTMQKYNFQKIL
jgi:hypothetical protein